MPLILRLPVMGAIVIFWGIMWTLLIRSELRPAQSALRALPLELVLRQYFQHEQPSALFLREHGETVGHLRVVPALQPDGCSLGLLGGLQLNPPGGQPVRAGLEGTLRMDRDFHPTSMKGAFTSRAAPSSGVPLVRVEFSADLAAGQGHYRYLEDSQTVLEQDFTLDEAGLADVLQKWGIGPEWKKQAPPLPAGGPEVTARQVRLTIRDEPAEATEVFVRMGGQTWLEISLTPLGQVLEVKTLWGWTLSAE